MMFGFDRITHNPDILGGKACIRGMRIPVSLIVNLVANGMTVEEIIDEYPDLEPEDIRQALRYAAWTAEDMVYRPVQVNRYLAEVLARFAAELESGALVTVNERSTRVRPLPITGPTGKRP